MRRERRLKEIGDEEERKKDLFDVYLSLALAHLGAGSSRLPQEWIDRARELDPSRAESDATFLYASGETQTSLTSKLHLYQRAVELEPRFEIARFSLAVNFERLWRVRPTLERNVADMVQEDYEEVLKINPGCVAAWANHAGINVAAAEGLHSKMGRVFRMPYILEKPAVAPAVTTRPPARTARRLLPNTSPPTSSSRDQPLLWKGTQPPWPSVLLYCGRIRPMCPVQQLPLDPKDGPRFWESIGDVKRSTKKKF